MSYDSFSNTINRELMLVQANSPFQFEIVRNDNKLRNRYSITANFSDKALYSGSFKECQRLVSVLDLTYSKGAEDLGCRTLINY